MIHLVKMIPLINFLTKQVLTDDQKSLGSMSNSRPSLHRAEEEITSRFLALGEYPKVSDHVITPFRAVKTFLKTI